jgi:hypothetical protein
VYVPGVSSVVGPLLTSEEAILRNEPNFGVIRFDFNCLAGAQSNVALAMSDGEAHGCAV